VKQRTLGILALVCLLSGAALGAGTAAFVYRSQTSNSVSTKALGPQPGPRHHLRNGSPGQYWPGIPGQAWPGFPQGGGQPGAPAAPPTPR
jgi:hypothetical protein